MQCDAPKATCHGLRTFFRQICVLYAPAVSPALSAISEGSVHTSVHATPCSWFAGVNLFEGVLAGMLLGRILTCLVVGGGSQLLHQVINGARDLGTEFPEDISL